MKKGRSRRYEEARALKHQTSDLQLEDVGFRKPEPCPECGAEPGDEHSSWCVYEQDPD